MRKPSRRAKKAKTSKAGYKQKPKMKKGGKCKK